MRTYQYSAFTVLDIYDTLYAVHKNDAGVGSGRRRQFFDLYGFLIYLLIVNATVENGFTFLFGSCN
jgi:hypothetical protein